MTEHDLTTLVRDHVSSDEPPFTLTPDDAIGRGRRAARTRRLLAGGATLAVLAVLVGLLARRDRLDRLDRQAPIAEAPGSAQP